MVSEKSDMSIISCISITEILQKKSMKQLKRPTLLISHWFPVEMVHNVPKLYKRKRFFLCCKFCSEVSRVSHIKADVLPFLKMWWFFNAIIFKPKLLLLKDKTTNPNMMMMMMTKIRRIYLRSFYRQILCRYFGCMPWWWWWLSTMFFLAHLLIIVTVSLIIEPHKEH